jgi:hypothetical protein
MPFSAILPGSTLGNVKAKSTMGVATFSQSG